MEWTEGMIARLRVLWEEGHPTAEIGRVVGISKNAVVGKAHRLGLAPRPSPIRREATSAALTPGLDSGVTLLPLGEQRSAVPEPLTTQGFAAGTLEKIEQTPVSRPPRVVEARRSPRAGTRSVACCWPIGEPATPGFRFCGAAALPGKPYCAAHAALAYVRVRDRRDDAA